MADYSRKSTDPAIVPALVFDISSSSVATHQKIIKFTFPMGFLAQSNAARRYGEPLGPTLSDGCGDSARREI
jgi:hypothetical protein